MSLTPAIIGCRSSFPADERVSGPIGIFITKTRKDEIHEKRTTAAFVFFVAFILSCFRDYVFFFPVVALEAKVSIMKTLSIIALVALSSSIGIGAELPRSSPEAQGVSSPALLAFIEAADKSIESMIANWNRLCLKMTGKMGP
jgi:hypothetical protein